jgi:hypothetical protein
MQTRLAARRKTPRRQLAAIRGRSALYIRRSRNRRGGVSPTRLDQVVAVDGGRHGRARQAGRHELASAGATRQARE